MTLSCQRLITNVGYHVIWGRVFEQNPQSKQQDWQGTYERNFDARSRNISCL